MQNMYSKEWNCKIMGEIVLLYMININDKNCNIQKYMISLSFWEKGRRCFLDFVAPGGLDHKCLCYVSNSQRWLSGSDEDEEGVWRWPDGSLFNYTNWDTSKLYTHSFPFKGGELFWWVFDDKLAIERNKLSLLDPWESIRYSLCVSVCLSNDSFPIIDLRC